MSKANGKSGKAMHCVVVLDRSGSMGSVAEEAVGGFNNYLETMQPDDRVTLVQFDDYYQVDYSNRKARKCSPLVLGESYEPRGMTALNDAICKAVHSQGKAKKVMFVILTDGLENASKEHDARDVRELLASREKRGWCVKWLMSQDVVSEVVKQYDIPKKARRSFDKEIRGATMSSFSSTVSDREVYRSSPD